MSCFDKEYYSCPDWPEYPFVVNGNSNNQLSHNVDHEYLIDLGFEILYSIKTNRRFSISGNNTFSRDVHAVTETSCDGTSTPPCLAWCYNEDEMASATISENCTITRDTIYYLDMAKQIVLYRRETETIAFSATSSETTKFKEMFGVTNYHKIKISGVKISGTEQFILVFGGERRILNEINYLKEPTWMMGSIGIPTLDRGVIYPTNCDGYDHSIQQIIVWPVPISMGIPLDLELRCLGFYDYGFEQPGVVPELVEKDGGRDFFYPSWIRESMVTDKFYASVRDRRFSIVYEDSAPIGIAPLTMPEVEHDVVPKGNAVYDSQLGKMFSFTFTDRDGVAHSVAELDGKDPKSLIINNDVTGYGDEWSYHPISIL